MIEFTVWQRIHRRISLLVGSYTHPDGSIELDFEAAAGVDHYGDSEEIKAAKVERRRLSDARTMRVFGAVWVGLGVYFLTRPNAPWWQVLAGVIAIAMGLLQVARK